MLRYHHRFVPEKEAAMRVSRSSLAFGLLALGGLGVAQLSMPARADEAPAPPASAPRAACKKEWTYAWGDDAKWARIQGQLDEPAKAFTVGSWINGDQSLDKLKGKIVVVQFWATWCRPCRASVPSTNALQETYRDRGVQVIGVCNSQERGGGTMPAAVEATGMKYPTAQDQTGRSAADWGVTWWPYYFVVDRQGVIRGAGLTPSGVQEMIEALLKEQPQS
jgi:thiol-disulfide isomerase/thioredoxin